MFRIQDFINESNNFINNTHIDTGTEAFMVRFSGIVALTEYYKNKKSNDMDIKFGAKGIYVKTKKNLKLSTGEIVEFDISINFKTCIKKTGNIIPVSKLQSKYELTVSDKFLKLDNIEIFYYVPNYEFNSQNGKIEKTNGKRIAYLTPFEKIDKNWTIDDIVKNIDLSEVEYVYNDEIAQKILLQNMITPHYYDTLLKSFKLDNGEYDIIALGNYVKEYMMEDDINLDR